MFFIKLQKHSSNKPNWKSNTLNFLHFAGIQLSEKENSSKVEYEAHSAFIVDIFLRGKWGKFEVTYFLYSLFEMNLLLGKI